MTRNKYHPGGLNLQDSNYLPYVDHYFTPFSGCRCSSCGKDISQEDKAAIIRDWGFNAPKHNGGICCASCLESRRKRKQIRKY